MGITLEPAEIEAFLDTAHTGVLTTLRADGWPVGLPIWFVRLDGALFVRTPATASKVGRVRRDARVSFMVERGESWDELAAVVVTGRARVEDDPDVVAAVAAAFDRKYAAFRPARETLPDATRRHYGSDTVVLRIDPVGVPTTWDNTKIRRR